MTPAAMTYNATQIIESVKNIAGDMSGMKPKSPATSTLYNFGFGTVFAFKKAIEAGYLNRAIKTRLRRYDEQLSMQRAREAKTLLREYLSKGLDLPNRGPWQAGYFYNDALIRMDVCYEQLARYMGRIKNKRDYLYREELEQRAIDGGLNRALIRPWWARVRIDVIAIKHQSIYVTEGPTLEAEEALCIIKNLIEGIKSAFHKRLG
jgi:hypothetical protein